MRRFSFAALLAALAALGACSLLNAPDDVKPGGAGGNGGGQPSGASSSRAASSGTSSSSGSMVCSVGADCKTLDDVCGIGVCVNSVCQKQADPQKQGKPCDDGLFCTDSDTCDNGTCGGKPLACPPAMDACHKASCDEANKMCVIAAANDGASCEDGDPCSSGDTCFAGACNAGAPTDCSMLTTACTTGACTPMVGCQATNINESLPCDIANVCAKSQCVTGKCTPTSLFNGKACNDALFCTDNDTCNNAKCAGLPKVCPGATSCQTASCDEANKKCALTPIADGTACDDGNACTFGTKCAAGTCTPAGSIMACIGGDQCCPAGCTGLNDSDCLYWKSGVQQNVPEATLVGWTQCYSNTYADSTTPVATILTNCNKSKLLMACRPVGKPTFDLVAMAPRADVTFDCGNTQTCTKQSNGVGWYWSASWSWGFAPGGEAVFRQSCDYNGGGVQTFPNLRMCWHTSGGNIQTGYRCGDDTTVNYDSTWERRVYHAN